MIIQALIILLLTAVYAVMRYSLFGDVSLIHLPVYLMNKSISMTAAVSLFLASWNAVRGRKEAAGFWNTAFPHLVFLHILLSLAVLSRGYYPKFFDGERMNLTGEVTVLLGALAVYCFWRLGAQALTVSARRTLTALAGAMVAGHLFMMGFRGWLQVEKWHGALPPISLLCFLLVMCSLILLLWGEEKARSSSPAEGRAEREGCEPVG